jgi:hypothetical protein
MIVTVTSLHLAFSPVSVRQGCMQCNCLVCEFCSIADSNAQDTRDAISRENMSQQTGPLF